MFGKIPYVVSLAKLNVRYIVNSRLTVGRLFEYIDRSIASRRHQKTVFHLQSTVRGNMSTRGEISKFGVFIFMCMVQKGMEDCFHNEIKAGVC